MPYMTPESQQVATNQYASEGSSWGGLIGAILGGALAIPTGGLSVAAGMGLGSAGGQLLGKAGGSVLDEYDPQYQEMAGYGQQPPPPMFNISPLVDRPPPLPTLAPPPPVATAQAGYGGADPFQMGYGGFGMGSPMGGINNPYVGYPGQGGFMPLPQQMYA